MFADSIITDIRTAWVNDQNHPHRGRIKKDIPSTDVIRAFVETAFLASLKREEGRNISFSLAYLPKNDLVKEQEISGTKQIITIFENNIAFGVDSIVKLASAFNHSCASLAVGPCEEEGRNDFYIWGILFYTNEINWIKQLPIGIGDQIFHRPDIPIISSSTTGSIVISRGNFIIGRLVNGNFYLATPEPFISSALGGYLVKTFQNNKEVEKYSNRYWNYYSEVLKYLLLSASQKGHGGTIIIVPPTLINSIISSYIEKYEMAGSFLLEDLLLQYMEGESKQLNDNTSIDEKMSYFISSVALKKYISERIEHLAQLACVDGALLFKSNFELISFGATLCANKWSGRILYGYGNGMLSGQEYDFSQFGTRHNSALNFVGACPGVVGFVISQDGPVRGLVQHDSETIFFWPDIIASIY